MLHYTLVQLSGHQVSYRESGTRQERTPLRLIGVPSSLNVFHKPLPLFGQRFRLDRRGSMRRSPRLAYPVELGEYRLHANTVGKR